jgi:hypothetical protein
VVFGYQSRWTAEEGKRCAVIIATDGQTVHDLGE